MFTTPCVLVSSQYTVVYIKLRSFKLMSERLINRFHPADQLIIGQQRHHRQHTRLRMGLLKAQRSLVRGA